MPACEATVTIFPEPRSFIGPLDTRGIAVRHSARESARVADENVEPPEFGNDLIDHRKDALAVGDAALDPERANAKRLDFGHHAFGCQFFIEFGRRVEAYVVNYDVGAEAGQPERICAADPSP
jgi:hypothetical protein